MNQLLKLLKWVSMATVLSSAGTAHGQNFETMEQKYDILPNCEVPRPPKDLDSFAYVRNGYREILRITAVRAAIEEENCGCPFEQIDWDAVVAASDEFRTSDNPKLPFDVIDLRSRANALETELAVACGK